MFDINFYMNLNGDPEKVRSREPYVYNIETTNACNMKCYFCPRTTLMTRPVITMKPELFRSIVDQLKPHDPETWKRWEAYCEKRYGVPSDGMSENHFFLYVIPRVIQLHGYGDPLLDSNMGDYVGYLHDKGFQSYFSCNPANIDVTRTIGIFARGLDYIKYSIESVSDVTHQLLRGPDSDFTKSYKKIMEVLEKKEKYRLGTTVVITMLDLHRPNQENEFDLLKVFFEGTGVYIYFKSQDTQWLQKENHGTKSIHWSEPCKHPWMSMTIKSNGEACQCMEDWNNAIVLGDTNTESLYDIWNGDKYRKLRQDHMELTKGIQCTERCDMRLMGSC